MKERRKSVRKKEDGEREVSVRRGTQRWKGDRECKRKK